MTASARDDDVQPTEPGTSGRSDRLIIAVAAACLVAGFVAGRTGAESETQAGRDDAVAPATATSPSEEPEQPYPQRILRLGKSYRQFDGRRTTAAQFADPFPSDNKLNSPAGTRWVGLEVETCADADMSRAHAFSVSALDWKLVDAHGARYRPERIGSDMPLRLLYPSRGVAVYPGKCVRGWVLWGLPKDSPATTALFSPTPTWFGSRGDDTVEWTLT